VSTSGGPSDRVPRLYLPKPEGPELWVPRNPVTGGLARPESPQYLNELGLWVFSADAFYTLRSRLRTYPIEEFLGFTSKISWLRRRADTNFKDLLRQLGQRPDLHLRDYQLAMLVRILLLEHDFGGARRIPFSTDAEAFRWLNESCLLVTNLLPRGLVSDLVEIREEEKYPPGA
jgi:hypothetical protein